LLFGYHCESTALVECVRHIESEPDWLLLLLQYLKEIYCVPAQPLVIKACADLVKARVAGDALALSGRDRGAAEMMKGWLTSTGTGKGGVAGSPAGGKPGERLLILVGTYSIGKERLAKGESWGRCSVGEVVR